MKKKIKKVNTSLKKVVRFRASGFRKLCTCGSAFDFEGFCGSGHEQGKSYQSRLG